MPILAHQTKYCANYPCRNEIPICQEFCVECANELGYNNLTKKYKKGGKNENTISN